jgi:hypothetical protein
MGACGTGRVGGSVAETGEGRAEAARLGELRLEELDREELERFGRILDQRPATLRGRTVGMALAERLLFVRARDGSPARLRANATQRAFERRRGSGTSCSRPDRWG